MSEDDLRGPFPAPVQPRVDVPHQGREIPHVESTEMNIHALVGRQVEHLVVEGCVGNGDRIRHATKHITLRGDVIDDVTRCVVSLKAERLRQSDGRHGVRPDALRLADPQLGRGRQSHQGPETFMGRRNGLRQFLWCGKQTAVAPLQVAAEQAPLHPHVALEDSRLLKDGPSAHPQVTHDVKVSRRPRQMTGSVVVLSQPVALSLIPTIKILEDIQVFTPVSTCREGPPHLVEGGEVAQKIVQSMWKKHVHGINR